MMDHDYTAEFHWEKPLLSLTQLCILAVLNSERLRRTAEDVVAFIYRHFPFHKDTPPHSIKKTLSITNSVLREVPIEGTRDYEYVISASKVLYCVKKFRRFYKYHPDPYSSVYSMKYPGLWETMMKGDYRENELLENVKNSHLPASVEKIWPKPTIPERFLITLAIANSESGRLLASEIFAFIEYHFPYYQTADKKWKRSTANEALKAPRGLFGRQKLVAPLKNNRRGNGSLNLYFIRPDRIANRIADFFDKYEKEHPNPEDYGMRHPELWPQMRMGQLNENKDIQQKISWGKKACSQSDKIALPTSSGDNSQGTAVIKPILNTHLFAGLAYLHLKQEFALPRQFHEWLQENIYFFRKANPTWKTLFKAVLHKSFVKKLANPTEMIADKEDSMVFGLDEEKKKKLVLDLITFERRYPDISIDKYGVSTKEKWNRIFPKEFREVVDLSEPIRIEETKEVEDEKEVEEKGEELEEFADDDDYDMGTIDEEIIVEEEQKVEKEILGTSTTIDEVEETLPTEIMVEAPPIPQEANVQKTKVAAKKQRRTPFIPKELKDPAFRVSQKRDRNSSKSVSLVSELVTGMNEGARYGTRKRKIDFNKLTSYEEEEDEGYENKELSRQKKKKSPKSSKKSVVNKQSNDSVSTVSVEDKLPLSSFANSSVIINSGSLGETR